MQELPFSLQMDWPNAVPCRERKGYREISLSAMQHVDQDSAGGAGTVLGIQGTFQAKICSI